MTLDDAIHRAAEESKDHKGHRLIWVSFAVLLMGALALAVVVFVGRAQSEGRVDELSRQSAQNADTAAKLADQVRALGATPVVEPPRVPAEADPATIRQAARAAVADYCAAPSRPCRGADGTSPSFDLIVDAVMSRIPAPQPGRNGADGEDGADATTAQVTAAVAAYCGQPTEPCRGPAGVQGQPGQDGKPGADGQPGPSCPDGYTAQSRRQGTETWWVCVAAEPIPPN
ncbi:hypothetical protein [Amycolatopsis lurida]|uniref:hypothetical protein n=1 Tax=Amycolatopsis lurida TaxID=31959 RepID=UPI003662C669